MKGIQHLRQAIKRHGGTYDAFATEVLGRSRTSVWRWLRGTHPIPNTVIARLRLYNKKQEARHDG